MCIKLFPSGETYRICNSDNGLKLMTPNDEPSAVYWLNESLYLNITNRCSNNCWFCFRNYRKGVGSFNLKLKEDPSAAAIKAELQEALSRKSWREVVFCGFGEPTERLDLLLEIAQWMKSHSPNVSVRLDTNGHGCAFNPRKDVAKDLKAAGISKVSVSLNGWDEESYCENCRPTIAIAFQTVLEFIKRAKAAELDVEVSAVRMPELDISKVKAIADSLGVPFRIRDYVPCFW